MHAILELLHDNEPLTTQLKGATSMEAAVRMIVDAAGQRGKALSARDVESYLAQRPRGNAEALSEEELEAVSGGRAAGVSILCCNTCFVSLVLN